MQSFQDCSSTDSASIVLARQSAGRPRHDRSDVQWNSRTDRYTDAPNDSRPYDNRYSVDLRHCRNSQAPTQRWNHSWSRSSHSRSRSPQYYGRAASPLRSEKPFPYVRRSPSPHDQAQLNVENLRRQLLAKRAVSLDAFRDEMKKRHNGLIREENLKWPHETMVRIPVILWPDETMAQYTQKVERWLESRNLSLALLRDNPAKERSLWHSFAYTRAGTSELKEAGTRSRSRSRSESSSRNIQRSPERGHLSVLATFAKNNLSKCLDSKFSRKVHARSSGKHPPFMVYSREIPRLFKTRHQMLARRIVSLEEFQKEMDQSLRTKAPNTNKDTILSAIPVPLYPRESMGHYDHRFWLWLRDYGETKDSLRANPLRERKFRVTFASLRTNRSHVLTATGDLSIGTQTTLAPRPNIETHTKMPVGILKLARSRLHTDRKRPVDTNEHQTISASEEPSSKRARIDAEGVTQVQVISPEQKSKPASSNQSLPQSSLVPTNAPSTETSSTATVASLSSAGSVRLSILPQTAPENRADVQPACSASIPIQQQQKKIRAEQVKAPDQKTKTSLATTSNSVASSTKTAVFHAGDMATNAEMACFDQGLSFNSVEKPTEATVPSKDKVATWKSATSLIISKPEMLQAKFWDRQTPELEPQTSKSDLAATRSSPFPLAPPVSRLSAKVSRTTAAAPIKASPSADVTTTITKVNPSVNFNEKDSANTYATEFEPDVARTESVAQAVSDAKSDPADASERHDGDVMNPNGCCCAKCMLSWAKILTDRMDQLEQNVLDMKRQAIGQAGAKAVIMTAV